MFLRSFLYPWPQLSLGKPLIIQHTPRYTQNVSNKTKAQKQDNVIPLVTRMKDFQLPSDLI